jgi:restriction system protein
MPRRKESLFVLFASAPWWVGVIAALGVYLAAAYAAPAYFARTPMTVGVGAGLAAIAWLLPIPFLVAALASAVRAWMARRTLDAQSGIESIRALHWKQFESLVGEAYRRRGFAVREVGGGGPDGGVDIELRKDGKTTLVQCKQWRTVQIGVKPVRELFGVMTAEHADQCALISSGTFTADARTFARDKPIELVDGHELQRMIAAVREPSAQTRVATVAGAPLALTPACPICGKEMTRRVAQRGANAGSSFWGCKSFPACRGIRSA